MPWAKTFTVGADLATSAFGCRRKRKVIPTPANPTQAFIFHSSRLAHFIAIIIPPERVIKLAPTCHNIDVGGYGSPLPCAIAHQAGPTEVFYSSASSAI